MKCYTADLSENFSRGNINVEDLMHENENNLILKEWNTQYKDNRINDNFRREQLQKSFQHVPFEEKESQTQIHSHSDKLTGSVLKENTDTLKIEDDISKKHARHPDTAIAEYSKNLLQSKSESKEVVTSSKLLVNLHTNSKILKSDPEIVKPPTKSTTIRPHKFIIRPEITQIQQFTKPNR